jgi:hypothetical protein
MLRNTYNMKQGYIITMSVRPYEPFNRYYALTQETGWLSRVDTRCLHSHYPVIPANDPSFKYKIIYAIFIT